MTMTLWCILIFMLILILYHHAIYYPIMLWLAKQKTIKDPTYPMTVWPKIAIIISAYNEEKYIIEKLNNILQLDYPAEQLSVYIANDGSMDRTFELIQSMRPLFKQQGCQLILLNHRANKGKLHRLNELITHSSQDSDLLAFTDVSAQISRKALKHGAQTLQNPNIGAITSYYTFAQGNPEESEYWRIQNEIRLAESTLGNVIGCNGAFYLMRTSLYTPLPKDTINDDFMLPMMVIKKGKKVQLNPNVQSIEQEVISHDQDYQRRERIGAGNIQQLMRCHFLFSQKFSITGWLFLSGKGLRTLMPFLLLFAFLLSLGLTLMKEPIAFYLFSLQILCYSIATLPLIGIKHEALNKIHYITMSYLASLQGMSLYLFGQYNHGWKTEQASKNYKHTLTIYLKRLFDILLSSIGLLITLPLWPIIAGAIRFESKGSIFFRQVRVGEIFDDYSTLFYILKFRTMYCDPEAEKKATWASPNDPRITRVGTFLRRTRLDELPQFINVIKGDMSLIGPRPERPIFCQTLNQTLPFYIERTKGLKPGVTGLAQIHQGYDNSIDDVKQKLLWDHAYAATLGSPRQWLIMDIKILLKTVLVMIQHQGQ